MDELLRQLDTNTGGDKVKSVSRPAREVTLGHGPGGGEASKCELNEERFNLVCNALLEKLQSLLDLNTSLLDSCDSMLHERSEAVTPSREAAAKSPAEKPATPARSKAISPVANANSAGEDADDADTARDAPADSLPEDPVDDSAPRAEEAQSTRAAAAEGPIRLARTELRSFRQRLLSGYSQYVQSLMLSDSDSLLCRFLLLLVGQRFASSGVAKQKQRQSAQAEAEGAAGDADKSEMEAPEKAEHFFHSDAELVVLLYSDRLVQLLLTHHKRLKEANALPQVPRALPAFFEGRADKLEVFALVDYLSQLSPDLADLSSSFEKQSAQWDQWYARDCDAQQLPQVGKKTLSASRRAFLSLLLTSVLRRECFVPQLSRFVRTLEAGSSGADGDAAPLPVRVLRESECWRGCLVLCGSEDVEEVRSAMEQVAQQLSDAQSQSGGEPNLLDDTPRAEQQSTVAATAAAGAANTILDVRVEALANHESIALVQSLVEAIDPERDSLAASPRIRPMRLVAMSAPRLSELLEQPTAAARLRYFLVVPASLMLKLGAASKRAPASTTGDEPAEASDAADAVSVSGERTTKSSASPKSVSSTRLEEDSSSSIDAESL